MSASPVTVRVATDADVVRLVALIESAYRGDASRQGWTTEADLLDGQRTDVAAVREVVSSADALMLLAELGEAAFAGCCQVERRSARFGYFGSFAVDPTLQAQGIGSRLLAAAERLAVERWRLEVMEMTVIEQREDLITWYERRGYRRTGETRPFPYGDERFGRPRRDDLRFAVLSKPLA